MASNFEPENISSQIFAERGSLFAYFPAVEITRLSREFFRQIGVELRKTLFDIPLLDITC